MRTKTLILTAALGAAGIATSMAQVFSVNAVGYINLNIPPGYSIIANQLVQTSTTLNSLIPTPAPGTTVYKFGGGNVFINVYDPDLGWDPNGNETFDLGGGLFILNPTASPFTITLVGDVPQGAAHSVNPVLPGFSLMSSKTPQSGLLQDVLKFPPVAGDTVSRYSNLLGTYLTSVFDPDLGWDPGQPEINVGEGFFLQSSAGHASWIRVFTVN